MSTEAIITTDDSFRKVCKILGYNNSNGLVENKSDIDDEFQKSFIHQAKEKLGIDAILFFKPISTEAKYASSIPLIIFKKLQYRDNQKISEIHKLAWNLDQIPLF